MNNPAFLILQDGSIYHGSPFGYDVESTFGEVVFNRAVLTPEGRDPLSVSSEHIFTRLPSKVGGITPITTTNAAAVSWWSDGV